MSSLCKVSWIAVCAAACSGGVPPLEPTSDLPVTGNITVTPPTATISPTAPGNTVGFTAVQLSATGAPVGPRPATWSVQHPQVATINNAGGATAVGEGRTTVTATVALIEGGSRVGTATLIVMGAATAAHVGQWAGTVDGAYGTANTAMTLHPDFTVASVGDAGPYTCALAGDWRIEGNAFTATTQEVACTRTFVTFTGTITGTTMTGTWSASSGASGSFTSTKI